MRRCSRCGSPNPLSGLRDSHGHVGGSGYVWELVCRDQDACRRRQDRDAQSVEMQAALEATRAERRVLR
jgi:hypothetical protein